MSYFTCFHLVNRNNGRLYDAVKKLANSLCSLLPDIQTNRRLPRHAPLTLEAITLPSNSPTRNLSDSKPNSELTRCAIVKSIEVGQMSLYQSSTVATSSDVIGRTMNASLVDVGDDEAAIVRVKRLLEQRPAASSQRAATLSRAVITRTYKIL